MMTCIWSFASSYIRRNWRNSNFCTLKQLVDMNTWFLITKVSSFVSKVFPAWVLIDGCLHQEFGLNKPEYKPEELVLLKIGLQANSSIWWCPFLTGFMYTLCKIDHISLAFSFKGVQIWIVCHLSSPRLYFRAGYWVDNDDDDDDDDVCCIGTKI